MIEKSLDISNILFLYLIIEFFYILNHNQSMEIRVLKYFLEAAREGSITKAAQKLNVTQPTMSKQLKDLEAELGQKLFTRTNYNIKLTAAGRTLQKRAEDIVTLANRTVAEFKSDQKAYEGDIYVGCPESASIKYFARAVKAVQSKYPRIRCNLYSGNLADVTERLDRGLLDFALVMDYVDLNKYAYLDIPAHDIWGVVMRKDDPLADRKSMNVGDLYHLPLICSRQGINIDFPKWFGADLDKLNIVATFNLGYNAFIMVRESVGYAVSYDRLADTHENSDLKFIPLENIPPSEMKLIWRKSQVFSLIAALLLEELKKA